MAGKRYWLGTRESLDSGLVADLDYETYMHPFADPGQGQKIRNGVKFDVAGMYFSRMQVKFADWYNNYPPHTGDDPRTLNALRYPANIAQTIRLGSDGPGTYNIWLPRPAEWNSFTNITIRDGINGTTLHQTSDYIDGSSGSRGPRYTKGDGSYVAQPISGDILNASAPYITVTTTNATWIELSLIGGNNNGTYLDGCLYGVAWQRTDAGAPATPSWLTTPALGVKHWETPLPGIVLDAMAYGQAPFAHKEFIVADVNGGPFGRLGTVTASVTFSSGVPTWLAASVDASTRRLTLTANVPAGLVPNGVTTALVSATLVLTSSTIGTVNIPVTMRAYA